jgi:hypothetical protein
MMGEAAFPIDKFRDAALDLRRPFEGRAIKWKVQTQFGQRDQEPTGAMIVAYIDRGLVIDRLNVVVPHLWSAETIVLEQGHALCKLTIDGITREDVGEGGTLKARYSDALKRVAVHFGIGVSLARVPKSRLWVKDGGLKTFQGSNGKWHLDFTEQGIAYLRERYQKWLIEVGTAAFGDPLSHGDLGDAQGDDEIADESIIDDHTGLDLYISLSECGLLPRQQVGLINQAGGTIVADAGPKEIQAAVLGLTEDQAAALNDLIVQRIEANEREQARREGRAEA